MFDWTNGSGGNLTPFLIYLQEEDRRGAECCVNKNPCPSPDPLMPTAPEYKGCSGWPSGCYLPCDSGKADFKTSAELSKTMRAYAWVFHTYAGGACDDNPNNPDKTIYEYMDPVEQTISKNATNWLP